jgi:hypothetical protein
MRVPIITAVGILAGFAVGAVASAQTSATPSAPNCAITTARIGTLDIIQFFGVRDATTAQQSACLRLEVANPTPGDLVPAGGYVIGGFAFDPASTSGPGVTEVQVFLDDPNQGGSVIGSTSAKGLGLSSSTAASFGDQFASSGFTLTVQIPTSAAGGPHALFIAAQANSGRVGTVAIPVVVGNLTPAVPTRTPQ